MEPVVAVDTVPVSVTGKATARSRSIRKRKFMPEELEKTNSFIRPVTESEAEGPFWFEKSSTSYVEGQKIHHGITRREHQLLRELVKSGFFTTERLTNVVVPLNDESSKTPRLRAFDWAVTNFAKGRPQLAVVDNTIVDPNIDYQSELKKHHRLLFDPFRRGTHIFFELPAGPAAAGGSGGGGHAGSAGPEMETHRTTVGQLCFIKWCVDHHVDRYVEAHLDDIRAHMSSTTKKQGHVKRRRELTSAPRKMLRGAVFENMVIGQGPQ